MRLVTLWLCWLSYALLVPTCIALAALSFPVYNSMKAANAFALYNVDHDSDGQGGSLIYLGVMAIITAILCIPLALWYAWKGLNRWHERTYTWVYALWVADIWIYWIIGAPILESQYGGFNDNPAVCEGAIGQSKCSDLKAVRALSWITTSILTIPTITLCIYYAYMLVQYEKNKHSRRENRRPANIEMTSWPQNKLGSVNPPAYSDVRRV